MKMQISVGPTFGGISAVLATLAGLSASWVGFSSTPYTQGDLGMYIGCVSAILGGTAAFAGYAFQRSRSSAKSVA